MGSRKTFVVLSFAVSLSSEMGSSSTVVIIFEHFKFRNSFSVVLILNLGIPSLLKASKKIIRDGTLPVTTDVRMSAMNHENKYCV